MPLPWILDPRKYRFRTSDLLMFIAIFAVAMAIGIPTLNRMLRAEGSVSAMMTFDIPQFSPSMDLVNTDIVINRFKAYLDTSRAIQDIRDNPLVSTLPAPPSAEAVRLCVRDRLRIEPLDRTTVLSFSLIVEDVAIDTAIVNAVLTSIVQSQPASPAAEARILSYAMAPEFSPSQYRARSAYLSVLFLLFVVVASLIALLGARLFWASTLRIIRLGGLPIQRVRSAKVRSSTHPGHIPLGEIVGGPVHSSPLGDSSASGLRPASVETPLLHSEVEAASRRLNISESG